MYVTEYREDLVSSHKVALSLLSVSSLAEIGGYLLEPSIHSTITSLSGWTKKAID